MSALLVQSAPSKMKNGKLVAGLARRRLSRRMAMTSSRRRRAAVQVWARDLGAASRVSAVALPLAVSPSAPSPAALRAFHPAHDPTAHDGTDRLSLRAHALERCDLALRAEA